MWKQHRRIAAALCLPTPTPSPCFQSICALIIIICYVAAAAHYLELGCGQQDSEEVTRWDVAAAGLHFLAALLAHAAQMDTHAPADPGRLAFTEAANDSVTVHAEQDCRLAAIHWPVSHQLCACDAAINISKPCPCTCEHIALLLYTF